LRKNFNGYIAMEPGVLSTIHFAHPAFTDRREDFVRAEFIACSKRHLD
jgi:hypothetical protein